MSAFTEPMLIDSAGQTHELKRMPLTVGGSGGMSEKWLQEAIFKSPKMLPIKEIDPHMGPLIPICMEIETGAGPADILFVTPTGQVVLVETKLWRNPEARREVVGQILDYAKQLTAWTYDVLEQKAATAARAPRVNYLLSCLRRWHPESDESAFVDGVRRSLSTGDFLLLIVGDGIRFGAESLIAFLERYGHLRFGLGLVEVATYRMPDGGTLLQPRILAKTEILQRTVLIGAQGPVRFEEAAQAEDLAETNAPKRDWFASFWSDYLKKVELDDAALKPVEAAKGTNQYFPMPPGGDMAWISAYVAKSSKRAGVYLTFSKRYGRATEIYELLRDDRESLEREVGLSDFKFLWEQSAEKVFISAPGVTFTDLGNASERDRVTTYLADMTERMIRVFKVRLEALTR